MPKAKKMHCPFCKQSRVVWSSGTKMTIRGRQHRVSCTTCGHTFNAGKPQKRKTGG